jgi:hypothetical protein
MAPIRPKPLIDGAVSMYNWTPDQALVNNRVVSSVKFGHGAVNVPDTTHHQQVDQQASTANVHCFVSAQNEKQRGALIDRRANGGIAGDDTRVIHQHLRKVDVTGIDNHEMTDLKIADTASWVMSNKGPIILIFNQYAYHGLGRSIHSAIQLEHYKNRVDDRSIKSGGRQCLTTLEGYVIPLDIINGLPYMKMHPQSDDELRALPHIIMTSGER